MVKLSLTGVRVAILAADGVEQVALTTPRAALDAAGARSQVVAPARGHVTTWHGDRRGIDVPVDVALDEARADDFDGLLVPGGVMSQATLHLDPAAVALVRAFHEQDKPIAAISHGPWLLAAADVIRGRHVTSWPTLADDLRRAGAIWVDTHAAVDGRLLTCRSPLDLASFMKPTIAELARSASWR